MDRFSHEDISAFVEAERQALVAFDMAQLSELAELKEALSAALAEDRVDLPDDALQGLRMQFQENAAHLAAAIEGIKSARMRLDAVKRVSEGFDSYGPDGQRRAAPQKPGSLARRA